MPLISTIGPEQAEGAVAEIHAEIQDMFGFVPNAIQLDSVNPEHMARHWNGIKQAVQHPTLSQKLFTLIRLLISEAQRCEYCVGLNTGILMQMHVAPLQLVSSSVDYNPMKQPENLDFWTL